MYSDVLQYNFARWEQEKSRKTRTGGVPGIYTTIYTTILYHYYTTTGIIILLRLRTPGASERIKIRCTLPIIPEI